MKTSAQRNQPPATLPDPLEQLFKPFQWVGEPDQVDTCRYAMLSNIRDLASGVSLALEMVERSQLDIEREDAPIIDTPAALRLVRMSIAAMNVIEGYVDEHFDEMQDSAAAQRNIESEAAK